MEHFGGKLFSLCGPHFLLAKWMNRKLKQESTGESTVTLFPHCMVASRTGAGVSELIKTALSELSPGEYRIFILSSAVKVTELF